MKRYEKKVIHTKTAGDWHHAFVSGLPTDTVIEMSARVPMEQEIVGPPYRWMPDGREDRQLVYLEVGGKVVAHIYLMRTALRWTYEGCLRSYENADGAKQALLEHWASLKKHGFSSSPVPTHERYLVVGPRGTAAVFSLADHTRETLLKHVVRYADCMSEGGEKAKIYGITSTGGIEEIVGE